MVRGGGGGENKEVLVNGNIFLLKNFYAFWFECSILKQIF